MFRGPLTGEAAACPAIGSQRGSPGDETWARCAASGSRRPGRRPSHCGSPLLLWHTATASGRGWTDGGSPTEGFLAHVAVGPMESTFHVWAGAAWAYWLFMLGLLGVGLALTAGVALRLAALAGTLMMALMWVAEWPPAQHLSDGSASMSTNPFADYHLVYAVMLIALAAVSAGDMFGLGRLWARLPVVRDHGWLR
ncbi:hypothetical protein [Streptomyces sp. ISL-63]|uniref:hypothetical protein n=1 Tax=unclassified Streptomyces TaxID=2593676 RepID=UPI0035AC1E87